MIHGTKMCFFIRTKYFKTDADVIYIIYLYIFSAVFMENNFRSNGKSLQLQPKKKGGKKDKKSASKVSPTSPDLSS